MAMRCFWPTDGLLMLGVVALRQRGDEVVDTRRAGNAFDLFVARPRLPEADVVGDGV